MSTSDPIRVLLVDDITSTLDMLRKLLEFEDDLEVAGTAGDGAAAIEAVASLQPDLVLMDVNMPVLDGISATEVLVREHPEIPVIIMSVQGERDYLRRAMQAGAREFLIKPFSGDELVASIRRVHQLDSSKRGRRPDAAAEEPVESNGTPAEPCQVVAVFSGKGGAGKSLIASNLATSLAAETGLRVALVDLDLQFGDLGVMLNLDPDKSIMRVVEATDPVDLDYIDDIMAVGPAGIHVLLAPNSPELADLVTLDHVREVLTLLRQRHDFIVVDCSSHLGEVTLEAIEQADRIIVLTDLLLPGVKEAKLALQIMQTLEIPREKVILVLNRSDSHSEFDAASVEQTLKAPIMVQIPSDGRLSVASIHRGVPFVTTNPEALMSQRIRELAGLILPPGRLEAASRAPRRRSFWAKVGA